MPRYYCDYCDTYLTHDSPSVRKQHNAGYKHKANVRTYYQQFEEQQTQSLIDQRIKEHLGQAAAFQQVGATFHHHLQSNPLRPRLPILPTPILPMPGSSLAPSMRPLVLPRPMPGAPAMTGYGALPTAPPLAPPPGATSLPMLMNGLPGPPPMNPPVAPGSNGTTSMGNPAGTTSMGNPSTYQANLPPSGSFDGYTAPTAASASQDSFTYSETNH